MQQKYLVLALSAILATTLTGCGSDNESNYSAPTPTTDNKKQEPKKEEHKKEDPKKEEPKKEEPKKAPVSNDVEDNPGGAANPGEQDKKASVVGQQYIRGATASFDKTDVTNKDAKDTGNATVVGFESLQNDKMTNIVVAQYPDVSTKDASGKPVNVKYLLGAAPTATPAVTDDNSLQTKNDADLLGNSWEQGLVYTTKEQAGDTSASYNVENQESKVNVAGSQVTQTSGASTATNGNDVRIYGALYNTDGTATTVNSTKYLVRTAEGKKVALTPKAGDQPFKIDGMKLTNVQYGRVTGNLDNLTADRLEGKTYIVADNVDKNFAGNKAQTDIYFYRGLNETQFAQMPSEGVYQYAGHALMYGIDNTYNGASGSGNSNSVAYGENGTAVGNFVQAEFDAGNRTVKGSVYNVWDKSTMANHQKIDLVTFQGDVVGNSIKGDADRTYSAGNDKAAFKGSFYGNKAQEMGGSFNSITEGYDAAKWGGVFGAKQLEKRVVTPPAPTPKIVPPINAVE
jgi:hypothetical protein